MADLNELNTSELIQIAREAGEGNLSRADRQDLIQTLVDGKQGAVCPLDEKREIMQGHIQENWKSLRTQLPGCNGKCVSFGCPDLIVQRCWLGFKGHIL